MYLARENKGVKKECERISYWNLQDKDDVAKEVWSEGSPEQQVAISRKDRSCCKAQLIRFSSTTSRCLVSMRFPCSLPRSVCVHKLCICWSHGKQQSSILASPPLCEQPIKWEHHGPHICSNDTTVSETAELAEKPDIKAPGNIKGRAAERMFSKMKPNKLKISKRVLKKNHFLF